VELPWFLGCFAEGLSLSFLPQHFQQLAALNGLQASAGSVLFTAAFAANMLGLLPAGRAAEAGQVRKLMTSGLMLSALAWMALAVEERWGWLIAIRCMGGLGQALLSAGAQSYVLKLSTGAAKARGSALVPSGYYGGVLSGMVIGALLGVYMGRPGVFAIAAMTALLALGAVLIRLPEPAPSQVEPGPRAQPTPGLLRGLTVALRDLEMLRVLLLVGLPTRMIFAGLVMFALPLLLAGQQYAQEDIGQILMFYSLGVLASNRYLLSGAGAGVSTRTLLLLGLAGTGLGLGLTGQMEWSPLLEQVGLVLLVPLVPITGLMVLGMGHGLILNAGVAYAARVPGASQLGELTAASTYRALERLGQVAGPTLAGVLLTTSEQRPVVLTWAGAGLLLFALLFLLGRKPTTA
jgi:MFS family permease